MKNQLLRLWEYVKVAKHWLAARLRPVLNRWILAIAGGLLAILQAGIVVINVEMSQTPVLGLQLNGRVVGNMQKAKAERVVAQVIRQRDDHVIHVKVGTYNGSVSPRQLGVHGNWQRQYQQLLTIGRSGNWLSRVAAQDRAVLGLYSVPREKILLNTNLVAEYLNTIDRTMSAAPTDAYFNLQHEQLVVVPEKAGVSIDKKPASRLLEAAAADSRSDVHVELPVSRQPAVVSSSQLQKLLPEAQAISAKPLTITAAQQTVTLSREELVSLMDVQVTSDPATHNPTVGVGFDEAKLNAHIDGLLKQAQTAPQPTVVANGKVYRAGTAGFQGEDDHPVAHILTALVERQTGVTSPDTVALPMRRIDPPVVPVTALSPAEQAAAVHGAPAAAQPVSPTSAVKNTGTVYLTFDDAPGQYTSDILDILKRYNVHATFYVIGRNAQRYPDQVKRMAAEGHTIGNHSYSHTNLSKMSAADVQNEIQATQTIIKQLTGSTPLMFRPPYGAQSAITQAVATSLGLSLNMWSIDPQDWSQPGTKVITDRCVSKASAGSVLLLHVLHRQTVDALPGIIEGMRAAGYTVQ